MARLFTLNFEFRSMHYTALVTCPRQEEDTCFKVSIYDEALQYLVPDGKLLLSTNGEEQPENKKTTGSPFDDLRNSVSRALSRYLQK